MHSWDGFLFSLFSFHKLKGINHPHCFIRISFTDLPTDEGMGAGTKLVLASAVLLSCWLVVALFRTGKGLGAHFVFQRRSHQLKFLNQIVSLVRSYYWDKSRLFDPFRSCSLYTLARAHTHPPIVLVFPNRIFPG